MTQEDSNARKAQIIKWLGTDIDGVLTDGSLNISETGESFKRFHVADGLGVELLRSIGIEVVFITSRESKAVVERARMLGVDHVLVTRNKLSAARKFFQRQGSSLENVAYVGDDLQDLDLLKNVGMSFGVPNAHSAVLDIVDHRCTNWGGNGAFREICERLIEMRGGSVSTIFQEMISGTEIDDSEA